MREIRTVGIVGAGAMGRGIAQVCATGGYDVVVTDARPGIAREAAAFAGTMIGRLAERGRISRDLAEAAVARLRPAEGFDSLADCDLVIEAIVEELEAKQALFRAVEERVGTQAILASNTSSLSITAIASACRHPARVAGLHFFNPVPLMRLVEVIPGLLTEEEVVEALTGLVRRVGHEPVRAADTPGFLVNHAGRAYGTEALRIVGEGIADYATVDRVMRDVGGFRMGRLSCST